jgi:hypothetical protein
MANLNEDVGEFDDGLQALEATENETRDALRELMNEHNFGAAGDAQKNSLSATVQYNGHEIYKSTLVSELNSNPFLSKDMLTRVHNSIFFNNSNDYVAAANSESSCLLGLGSDCAIYFVQRNTTRMIFAAKASMKRSRGWASRSGRPTNVLEGVDEGTWWLGRVQKMWRKVGMKWGVCRQPIDLYNRPPSLRQKIDNLGPNCMVLLNWFSRQQGCLKFKYDVCDSKWVDVDSIIMTISLTYNVLTRLYILVLEEATQLNEFVTSTPKYVILSPKSCIQMRG